MRKVSCDNLAIGVCEDDAYEMSLRRGDGDPVRLFTVIATTPLGVSQSYVLAESEGGAISQALCGGPFGEDDDKVTAQAYRLPLRVRGWSKTEF